MLLPSFALHGYVLSASVLGWEPAPIAWYLLGLLVSQGLLLSAAVQGVRRFSQQLSVANLRLLAGLVMGVGLAFAWTSVVP
jgi:urease accessory protein